MERLVEKFLWWLTYKLPRRLVYLATIRLLASATTNRYSHLLLPEITVQDAVKAWETP